MGRKPNQNEKKATQSSQESANEEEIEANEERNVSTKECVHILGILSFLYPCFILFANIIYVWAVFGNMFQTKIILMNNVYLESFML